MATETTVPIDDTGMLSDLMTDAPAERPAEAAPQPETDGPPRDELGRFAPKDPEPDPPATPAAAQPEQPEAPKDDDGKVPSWRLRELREAREAAERRAEETGRREYALQQQLQDMARQLAELRRPKEEPVDFFQNPDGAIDQRLSPLRSEFLNGTQKALLNSSKALAIAEYGRDAVKEMEAALDSLQGTPQWVHLQRQVGSSDHPVGVVMEWFQSHKLAKETGGDLAGYRQRILDEAMKDPAFQAKVLEAARGQAPVANNGRPNIQLPPSLSKVPGSAPEHGTDDSDMSDAGLFRHAMR